jgi:hypothetical protein
MQDWFVSLLKAKGCRNNRKNLVTQVKTATPDSRTGFCNGTPALFGTHVAEPERKGPALAGTQGIDQTSVVEKQAAAVGMFADTIAVFVGVEEAFGKPCDGQLKMPGQGCDLIRGDVDGPVGTHATLMALLAFELNPGVEKIGANRLRIGGNRHHCQYVSRFMGGVQRYIIAPKARPG